MPNISKLHLSGEKYSHLLLVCTLGIILSGIFSKILFITFSITQAAGSVERSKNPTGRLGCPLDDAARSQGDCLVLMGPVACVAGVVGIPSPGNIQSYWIVGTYGMQSIS